MLGDEGEQCNFIERTDVKCPSSKMLLKIFCFIPGYPTWKKARRLSLLCDEFTLLRVISSFNRIKTFRLHCGYHVASDWFTLTKAAIDLTKPTSCTGPGGISYRHLKHLAPVAIRALTDVFNYSIVHNTIPNIWKIGKIITILKPNKPPTEPLSYRPISLLCNPPKILERLVFTNITTHSPLSPTVLANLLWIFFGKKK